MALWTVGRLRRVRSSVDKAVEVMGGVVECSRRVGMSRMSMVREGSRADTAVEIVERIDARLGDCRVWCADGVVGACCPGDGGGCDPVNLEDTGFRVVDRAGTSLVEGALGAKSSLKPSTNANRPSCRSRARSSPYLRIVSAIVSRSRGGTYHSFPSFCAPECQVTHPAHQHHSNITLLGAIDSVSRARMLT